MGEISRCDIAWEVAFEVLSSECTPHQIAHILKKMLGLTDEEDLNPSEKCKLVLEAFEKKDEREKVCKDFRGYRRVVMCKAFELMEKEDISFSEAMHKAWEFVKEKCADVGVFI